MLGPIVLLFAWAGAQSIPETGVRPGYEALDLRWTSLPITQGDSIWLTIGKECVRLAKSGDSIKVREALAQAAKRRRLTSQEAFRFGVLTLEDFYAGRFGKTAASTVFVPVRVALNRAPYVPAKQYAKLHLSLNRFVESRPEVVAKFLGIARRLIAANPEDRSLAYYATMLLVRSKDPKDLQWAVATAATLPKRYPDHPSGHQAWAHTSFSLFSRRRTPARRKAALAAAATAWRDILRRNGSPSDQASKIIEITSKG